MTDKKGKVIPLRPRKDVKKRKGGNKTHPTGEPPVPQNLSGNRVLFADFSTVKFRTVTEELKTRGIFGHIVTSYSKLIETISEERIDVCIVNLLLGARGPAAMIMGILENTVNPDIKIIVVSRQLQRVNVQNTLKAGAHDFIAEPFESENLYNRIVYHLTPKTVISTLGTETEPPPVKPKKPKAKPKQEENAEAYLRLLMDSVSILSGARQIERHSAFLKILQRVANLLESNRTSLIVVNPESAKGLVVASSDDPDFQNFPINLDNYPEILHVVNSGSFVSVEDVSKNALTKNIQKMVRTIPIGSIMVFPITYQADLVGVLGIRRAKVTKLPSLEVLKVLQCLANILAANANTEFLLSKIYSDFPSARS